MFYSIVKDHCMTKFKSVRNSPTAWPCSRNVTNLPIYDFKYMILKTMKLNMIRVTSQYKNVTGISCIIIFNNRINQKTVLHILFENFREVKFYAAVFFFNNSH